MSRLLLVCLSLSCRQAPVSNDLWDLDQDGIYAKDDCDDNDPAIGTAPIWYADTDGDGLGDPEAVMPACDAPTGYVAASGDCDDTDPALTDDCST